MSIHYLVAFPDDFKPGDCNKCQFGSCPHTINCPLKVNDNPEMMSVETLKTGAGYLRCGITARKKRVWIEKEAT